MRNALVETVDSERAKKTFYPTPRVVAEKLLETVDVRPVKYILEPSAGKGDLVTFTVGIMDMMKRSRYAKLGLKADYPETEKEVSFRDIIHEFTAGSEWGEFGIDLCLGSEADEPIDERKQMFAPFYMMEAARGAMIHRADAVVPLVLEEFKVVDAVLEDEPTFPLSPMTCAMGLLVATAFVVGWGIRKGRPCLAWNVLMFFLQGLGGCIVAFLFFFSLHPTVGSNWLLMLFHPLALFYLPIMIYRGIKGKKDPYHWLNVVLLTSFMILMPFISQEFNLTVLPLALSLLLVSVGHIYTYYLKNK